MKNCILLILKLSNFGTSLVVQWLRLRASTAGGAGSIPGRGTKIPHAAWCGTPPHQKKPSFLKMNKIFGQTLHIEKYK